jgi:hypothetical protein
MNKRNGRNQINNWTIYYGKIKNVIKNSKDKYRELSRIGWSIVRDGVRN